MDQSIDWVKIMIGVSEKIFQLAECLLLRPEILMVHELDQFVLGNQHINTSNNHHDCA